MMRIVPLMRMIRMVEVIIKINLSSFHVDTVSSMTCKRGTTLREEESRGNMRHDGKI